MTVYLDKEKGPEQGKLIYSKQETKMLPTTQTHYEDIEDDLVDAISQLKSAAK